MCHARKDSVPRCFGLSRTAQSSSLFQHDLLVLSLHPATALNLCRMMHYVLHPILSHTRIPRPNPLPSPLPLRAPTMAT